MNSMVILEIRKRDGTLQKFNRNKIASAVYRAMLSVDKDDQEIADELSKKVTSIAELKFSGQQIPTVEDIQDIVESVLIENGFVEVAKSYILYRQKRAEVRDAKRLIGVSDELKLSVNAARVLRRRYLLKDENGNVKETSGGMMRRIAKAIAAPDLIYNRNSDVEKMEEEFYSMLTNLEFLPNSPTLMNAGTGVGQLSACFVLPVEDSIEDIFNAVKYMAIIHKSGGGTGFSFSHLRPKGDVVKSTKGIASGPVSFMRIFDTSTEIIKQGGRRRGANMAILSVYHPDIQEFITSKSKEGFLDNFNISVAVDDNFMRAVNKGDEYWLKNPRSGEKVRKLQARSVFDLIVNMAWNTGDPGLVFLDEINRHNPTPKLGLIESTNPCGEQPLLPNESCNLGSINVYKMIRDGDIDWDRLREVTRLSVHFLDNVIDANQYPLPEIEKITRGNRKIGLGIMGWADLLIKLSIPYNSQEALNMAEKLMKYIADEARKQSINIGESRGTFPNFPESIWKRQGYKALRNATVTTIAPTGTISIIAGVASGIEPLFAISYVRNVMEGTKLIEVNSQFEEVAKNEGFYSRELMIEIAKRGSVKDISSIPEHIKEVFVTAFDIEPEWHVRMQAAFQKYVDNAVSKTINLPSDASFEDVRKVYLSAYHLKCKGITVYRYGIKKDQVLRMISFEKMLLDEHVTADSEYSGGCLVGECPY